MMRSLATVIFIVLLNTWTACAQTESGFIVSDKCSKYLKRQETQGNAYKTKDGVVCCLCGKGHFWEGDCTGPEYPYDTKCTKCQHDENVKTYIDYEPHKEEECQPDRCPNPFISVGCSIYEKSRCVCPEGYVEKNQLKPYCEFVKKNSDNDTKVIKSSTSNLIDMTVTPVTAIDKIVTPVTKAVPTSGVTENPTQLGLTRGEEPAYTASPKFKATRSMSVSPQNKDSQASTKFNATSGMSVPPQNMDPQGFDPLPIVYNVIAVFFSVTLVGILIAAYIFRKKIRLVCGQYFQCCTSPTGEPAVRYTPGRSDSERGETATPLNLKNTVVPLNTGTSDSGVDDIYDSARNSHENVHLLGNNREDDNGTSLLTSSEEHSYNDEDVDLAPISPEATDFPRVHETPEVQDLAGPIRYDNDDRSRDRREPLDVPGNELQNVAQTSDQTQPNNDLQRVEAAQLGSHPQAQQMRHQEPDPRLSLRHRKIREKALIKIAPKIQTQDLMPLIRCMISNESEIDWIRENYRSLGYQEVAWQLLRRGVELRPTLSLYAFHEKVTELGLGYLKEEFEDHIREFEGQERQH